MKIAHMNKFNVEAWIQSCQEKEHVQQVAFSTYHHALTQVCFSCSKIRTSMSKGDITA